MYDRKQLEILALPKWIFHVSTIWTAAQSNIYFARFIYFGAAMAP